jgi:hypothetical protein
MELAAVAGGEYVRAKKLFVMATISSTSAWSLVF